MGSGKGPRRRQRRVSWTACKPTGKRRFDTERHAQAVLGGAYKDRLLGSLIGVVTTRDEIRVYRCKHCLGWHLTSWTATTYQRRAAR